MNTFSERGEGKKSGESWRIVCVAAEGKTRWEQKLKAEMQREERLEIMRRSKVKI